MELGLCGVPVLAEQRETATAVSNGVESDAASQWRPSQRSPRRHQLPVVPPNERSAISTLGLHSSAAPASSLAVPAPTAPRSVQFPATTAGVSDAAAAAAAITPILFCVWLGSAT